MTDDPAPLLRRSREEPRHVDERDERDVEGVARADEAGCLHRGVDVEHARERSGLVPDDAHGVTAEPREPADDVLGPVRVHFEELAVVDDTLDDALHVVRLVRAVRDDGVERRVLAVDRIGRRAHGGASRLFCGRNERR